MHFCHGSSDEITNDCNEHGKDRYVFFYFHSGKTEEKKFSGVQFAADNCRLGINFDGF